MKRFALVLVVIGAMTQTTSAFAQTAPAMPTMDHSKIDHTKMGMPMPVDASAATKAYSEANAKMHTDMAIAYTGNADKDFIMGMLPHHQGAVEMAKIELQYGKDPKARKLARGIIKAQNEEIAWMKGWLAKNSK